MSLLKLPDEIQVNIFVRLPVNSILACRCVCKPLCNLLSQPNFIKNQLNRSIQKNKPRFILEHSGFKKFLGKNGMIYSVDYETILSSALVSKDLLRCEGGVVMDIPFEYEADLSKTVVYNTLGSCHGLICLGISTFTSEFANEYSVCIWNPATGEYKKVSLPVSYDDFRYGFGYASGIDDYKLVRISDSKIEVYALGSGSWSTIHTPDVPYSFPGAEPDYTAHAYGLLFKGALHWIAGAINNPNAIVSFDVSSERLLDFSTPRPCHEIYFVNLGVLGDCLCLAFTDTQPHNKVDLWVMQDYGVSESWTKQFTCTELPLLLAECHLFKPIWCFESGEILFRTDQDFLMLYDQKNETARSLSISDVTGIPLNNFLECYVESIVSLKSGTYVEKEICANGDMMKPKQQKKRIASSTSPYGPNKKAANMSSGSNNVSAVGDPQNDLYSIPYCTKHLQSLEGVSIRSTMVALEKFQDVGWRQVFMSLEPSLQKEWLKSIGS